MFRPRIALLALLASAACSSDDSSLLPSDESYAPGGTVAGGNPYGESKGGGVPLLDEETGPSEILDNREVDLSAALRAASLKLTGRVPDLATIKAFEAASDRKAFYEAQIDEMLESDRFKQMQIRFWQNTFKTGGNARQDAAAVFAARMVVEGRPYTDLFTASSNNCPTYNAETGAFADGECAGEGPKVGILTDPALLEQYFAPMAFRRVKFVQETFVCSQLPIEYSDTPEEFGNGIYTGPYEITDISGALTLGEEVRVDFHDNGSTLCVNCHVTLNPAAPLFAFFDAQGAYNANEMQVFLPDDTRATLSDYLPEGKPTAWRFGKNTADLAAYGQAMAEDPDVHRCAVTRAWNYAFSRGNVVDDASPVPRSISDSLLESFKADFKFKPLLRSVFTSDDFIRF